ncbi:MAG: sulfite exporter TauE/SafE family protein [Hyphomicrobiales bacterium]|nr:sulfite exporter TauE/SafE family protein [Hyphomicrobiales bacterium]MDE2115311.1 sulfite exporter TauE/SafE family protein [Hyphomicrobiales bacterium]
MSSISILLAFGAGILSILSPCVLPLLPLILASSMTKARYGLLALAAGLSLSFTLIGLFVGVIGFSIGLDQGAFRDVAAGLMVIVGLVLAVPWLQTRFTAFASPLSNWAEQKFGGRTGSGIAGQLGLGVLLGAVWSPCAGPTLGAASLLAAQGKDLSQVGLVMLAFGFGASLPMLLLGMVSRETIMGWRGGMLQSSRAVRTLAGGVVVAFGIAIVLGLDKPLEALLVDVSPAWLTRLTTGI